MSVENSVIDAASWGKAGDIIHSLVALQKLSAIKESPISLFIGAEFMWVSSLLDRLPWIRSYEAVPVDYFRVDASNNCVNVSHAYENSDPQNHWSIRGWWENGFHSIDFCASCAGISPLVGQDRVLRLDNLPPSSTGAVVLLPNCGDPMRSWRDDRWNEVVGHLNYPAITMGMGSTLPSGSLDRRECSLWDIVCAMREARLIISVDTMASASLAEAVGTPIVRIHRGGCLASSTGPGVQDWDGHRWVKDPLHNEPASVDTVMQEVRHLWEWK